ncbi:hypothetical protein [Solirubrobacter soli]|uniref:hypothetical protein n=1 Tax=Solirubrobacter soli TaxID=363832 RepID=UPI0012F8C444|nr:hypothetical protein [Solirubrobacter soli]
MRPTAFEPWRRPLAVSMLVLAGAVGGVTLARQVFDSPSVPVTAGAAVPDGHLRFSPEVPPTGGTVATGYHAAPPYGRVDPSPLKPRTLTIDIRAAWPQ